MSNTFRRTETSLCGKFCRLITFCLLALPWAWGTLAIYYAGPGPGWLLLLMAIFFACSLPLLVFSRRSLFRILLYCGFLFALLLVWWHNLQPTADKDWAPDVAKISHGDIQGDTLTMYNVRDFDYSSSDVFTEHWETRQYDLNKLQGLDLFLSYWASDHIAHTLLSWDFGDDNHLVISIETRKDVTQDYSAVKGFFKQYELAYVAADENDIIRLRSNYRKERVYMYRLRGSLAMARAMLESYLQEMNGLGKEPQYYDALMKNCTTSIVLHRNAIDPDNPLPLDWRLFLTGHLDELLYERGRLSSSLPFAQLRKKSRIDLRMQAASGDNYSRELRQGLPQ